MSTTEQTTETVPKPIGYKNASPFPITFSILSGEQVFLEGDQHVFDGVTNRRVEFHKELEEFVKAGTLKHVYASDFFPKPKAPLIPSKAPKAKDLDDKVVISSANSKGLQTVHISSTKGVEQLADTPSKTIDELYEEKAQAESGNVAIVRAADRSTPNAPAIVEKKTATVVSSVIEVDEAGIPVKAVRSEGGSIDFEGKTYSNSKALVRFIKSSGRSIKVVDEAELEDRHENRPGE